MKVRNLVAAAAGVCLLALSAVAQITALEGDVKGVDGGPAVGAVIKIVRTDIKGNYNCKTNKKGHYFYNGLPLGHYNITVEIDGKEMDSVGNVRTKLGDPTPIDFDLQKKMKEGQKRAAELDAAASGKGSLSKEQERGMSKEEKEKYDKAVKEREGALKKNKELNEAFQAGMAAAQAKDFDTAVTSFTKASEIDPKQVAVWAQLADAYTQGAKKKTGAEFDTAMTKAIEAYNKAIELNPADAATHNNFALALGQARKIPEMQAELQKAAELDPAKAGQYYFNLGAVLVNTGQSEPACQAFKKALELDPKHPDSNYQWGNCLMAKASFTADGKITPVAGTVEAFQKYLELAPTGPHAEEAKAMLMSLDAKVDTAYKNPNAPAPTTKKKK
jgi:tetratricopeptide (TPR) repeat protein